ncbi:MAG: hypothetical protein ACREOG_03845 [Gemmatimonadaceae bacterium]
MKFVRHLALAAVTAVAACGSDSTSPSDVATFVVQVGSEQFAVRVVDQATFAKLNARMQSGNPGVIIGRVVIGDGGFNAPWTWHLEPSSIDAPQASIELCDGTPSYLEAHRDEWIASVRDYCPWTAKVVSVR